LSDRMISLDLVRVNQTSPPSVTEENEIRMKLNLILGRRYKKG
jgi:hypothetical protein